MEGSIGMGGLERFEAQEARPRSFIILLVLVLLLAGKFTFGRLDRELLNYGLLVEPSTYLFLALLIGVLAIFASDKKPFRSDFRRASAFSFLVFIIYFWLACSTIWALSADLSIEYIPYIVIPAVSVLAIPLIFQYSPEKSMGIFFTLFFIAALIYAAGGIYTYHQSGPRMAAFAGGPNVFTRIMGTGIITAGYLWARTGKKAFLIAIPAFLVCVVLSGSRGGLLATLGSFFPFVVFGVKKRTGMKIKGLFILALLVAVILSIDPVRNSIMEFFNERFVNLTLEKHYVSQRDVLFSESWEIFKGHPVLGIGLNNFQLLTKTNEYYPHNFVLSLATEGGIFPLLVLTVMVWMIVRESSAPKSLEHYTALYLSLLFFIAGNFSGGHYDTRFMWVFLVFYMLPTGSHKEDPHEKKAGRMSESLRAQKT